jgi:hypothetical protein
MGAQVISSSISSQDVNCCGFAALMCGEPAALRAIGLKEKRLRRAEALPRYCCFLELKPVSGAAAGKKRVTLPGSLRLPAHLGGIAAVSNLCRKPMTHSQTGGGH